MVRRRAHRRGENDGEKWVLDLPSMLAMPKGQVLSAGGGKLVLVAITFRLAHVKVSPGFKLVCIRVVRRVVVHGD